MKVSLSFIVLATVMMLALSILPHHHHNGAACMVMERCEKDNSVNDEHTDHPTDKDGQHSQSCVAGSDYISNMDNRTKCKLSFHFFSIFCLAADFLLYPSKTPNPQFEYGEYISFYASAEANQCHGLRAPPFQFFSH